ncbi:MAG: hypothetical protein ACXWMF_12065 [Syntrophales bacterium]
MMKTNIGILASILGLLVPLVSLGSEPYKPFVATQYSSDEFNVSQAEFRNGDAVIRIIEAKRVSKEYELPHTCRAWLEVMRAKQITFRRYFDDIEAVGGSYGLFVPEAQPPGLYFAVVKNGDYDGRLFLVHTKGKVSDLVGGSYFISKNKRYLFSHYDSDTSGLAVFDLLEGRVVFSSDKLPAYQHQWYIQKGSYFFTASEWLGTSGLPHEKKDIAYFYDSISHKIVEKRIINRDLAASKPVAYDFYPKECEDCKVTHNKSLDRTR